MWAVSSWVAGVAAAGTVDDPAYGRRRCGCCFASPHCMPALNVEVIGTAEDREEGWAISVTGEEPESRRRLVEAQLIVAASGRERGPVYGGVFI